MQKNNFKRIPRQKRSKQSKDAIKNAGLKLFSQKGYFKTNSKEIAKEAGVAIGSFYMYFSDKKDLFKEVLVDYHSKIKDNLQSIDIQEFIKTGDSKKFITYIINKLIKAHDIYPEFHQELVAVSQTDPEIKTICNESKQQSLVLTKNMLKYWKTKLRTKDLDAAAVIVENSIEAIVHELIFSNFPIPTQRVINELSDMLCRYLFK